LLKQRANDPALERPELKGLLAISLSSTAEITDSGVPGLLGLAMTSAGVREREREGIRDSACSVAV